MRFIGGTSIPLNFVGPCGSSHRGSGSLLTSCGLEFASEEGALSAAGVSASATRNCGMNDRMMVERTDYRGLGALSAEEESTDSKNTLGARFQECIEESVVSDEEWEDERVEDGGCRLVMGC